MVQGEGGLWGPHAAFNYDCQMRVLSLLFGLLFISKSSQLYSEWTRWPENLVCFADLILIWDGRVWTRCKKLISWQNYTETCRTRRPWTEADCFFPWHGAESCGSLGRTDFGDEFWSMTLMIPLGFLFRGWYTGATSGWYTMLGTFWDWWPTRWAPTSYKQDYSSTFRGYNPNHPFIIRPFIGVLIPFITRRGPPCIL